MKRARYSMVHDAGGRWVEVERDYDERIEQGKLLLRCPCCFEYRRATLVKVLTGDDR